MAAPPDPDAEKSPQAPLACETVKSPLGGQSAKGNNVHKITTTLAGLGVAATAILGVVPAAQAATSVATAPTSVKGAPGNLSAAIFWAPPTSTGGSLVTSYHLYANGISKEVSATTRRWTFTKLRAGFSYKLYVSARNAKGLSLNATVVVKVYPAVKRYSNCNDLNKVYLHGVGRASTVVDHTAGVRVRNFYVRKALYDLNVNSDRDKDGIACERL